ncbi:hypothetical protein CYLTODRAFT_486931 [Cylindrobasidium torrendii FP15055 ss-10]|uniref:Uncharacterized protein n=1 Tax=Cylindrobasidium torrendii FP15055 ss-10 TaxID=1314674 RepID=A0A0D7BNQ9_9AGAR|nr:hypothetical protein CYLTODRAFT_486931 [Cylindrobasidium torrendii FP15055 ss-10]
MPPIQDFFIGRNYPYDPARGTIEQFKDMCTNVYHWGKKRKERKRALKALREAMAAQFSASYGSNDRSLPAWQNLCGVLDVQDIPSSITQCKKIIEHIYVNIWDLVDYSVYSGRPLLLHPTERALAVYTLTEEKVYPREKARANGLLRFLLRQILNPRERR